MKEQIDQFLLGPCCIKKYSNTPRWEYFRKVANSHYKGKPILDDAFSYLIHTLYSGPNIEKILQYELPKLEAHCVKVIKNYRFYLNDHSKFYNNVQLGTDLMFMDHWTDPAPLDLLDCNNFYEQELIIEGKVPIERVKQLSKLRAIYATLNPSYKEIYRLYFIEGLSQAGIAKLKPISRSSVAYMIEKLKKELIRGLQSEIEPLF